jgi:hypothetical protein
LINLFFRPMQRTQNRPQHPRAGAHAGGHFVNLQFRPECFKQNFT